MALTKVTSGAVSGLATSATTDTTDASNITTGTIPTARLDSTLDLSSKTVTLPAASVTAHATNPTKASIEALGIDLPAANLTGTIADARFPSTLPAISGAALTGIDAATVSATVPTSPATGDMWFNSSTSKVAGVTGKTMAVYNGVDWHQMSNIPLGTVGNPADNAADILSQNSSSLSGGYYILSNGVPIYVYCNMSDFSGGWMCVARSTSYNQWNSSTHSEYSSSNTSNFYSVLREAKGFTEVYIKWDGGGAWYNGYSGSLGLKAVSNITMARQGGDDLVQSTYSGLGTENDAFLYIKKSPCPEHRGTVFSNHNNNSQNQGGFMEYCGPHANGGSMQPSFGETLTYYEVYIR